MASRSSRPRRSRQQQLAQLNWQAGEVATRRILSLTGKSAAEAQLAWAAWGWEKVWTAQRAHWAAVQAVCALGAAGWTGPANVARVASAALAPIHRQVRSNHAGLRATAR